MKKNILFIVVDSVTNNQLFNSSSSKLKAPFLNELRKKAITGDKMYSQAPYTEAALMSLLGSQETLDKGGYMEKFKNKKAIFDIFNQNGYKTFFATYYPSIYPSYMTYGAQDKLYIENFNFLHLWEYRFEHYKNLYLKKETSIKESKMLLDMLEDNINAWIMILKLFKKNDKKTEMMNDCIDTNNIDDSIKTLECELKKFNDDKEAYLKDLFLKDKEHILFKIKNHSYIDKVNDDEFKKWFISEYYSTFKKIKKVQLQKNLKNARFPFNKLFKNITNKQVVKGLLAGYKNLLFDKDIMDRINNNYDLFKMQRSFNTVYEETLKWIEENNGTKPWVAYVHVDDAHYPENFFTYDTNNKKLVKEEFENINKYIDNLPKDYCGTISSDLSLLYCDNIIKKFYDYLDKKDMLNNTSIVITADHGFSYYFNPIREKYVITSYRENYNVPFIIYDKSIKPQKIKGYLSTKDIPATLLDLANINLPKEFKGKSLLNFEGRDHATIEYMGGGCPDMKRRPIILGVRTDDYDVVAEILNDNIEIKEVYDNKKDPYQNNNIKQINREHYKKEYQIIVDRYNEIKKDFGE